MYSGRFGKNGGNQGTKSPDIRETGEGSFWEDLNTVLQENGDADAWEGLESNLWKDTKSETREDWDADPGEDWEARDSGKSGRKKKGKKPLIWLIPLGILVIAVGVLVWCLSQYVMVGLHFYPQNAAMLDLREEKLSVSQYEKLAEKLPECAIYWNVPFQGKTYPSDTKSLTVTTLSAKDVTALDYLTKLQSVDARQCADYENLKALEKRRPNVLVDYAVALGEESYDPSIQEITLRGIKEEELPRMDYLEELKTVTVQGGGDVGSLKALQSYCHGRGLELLVELGDERIDDRTAQVTAEGVTEEELALLPLLENMSELKLINPQASAETVYSLQPAYPSVKVSWEIQIGGKTIPTDTVDVDLSTVKVESIEQVEKAMEYLPNVKTLFMGEQTISHDDMAAFRERVRDRYKVVWYIRLGKSNPIRTDITYFMPGRDCYRDNVTFTDATSYNIRYCEDLISVDVGHLGVKDVSWVAYLTNLEYLILAHTSVQYIDGIENCKKLKFLELDWSAIRTLDPLKGCTALEDLNIGNTWPDVSALKEMPWLKNIYMIFGSGKDAYELSQALPDTHIVTTGTATVSSGWRRLPNYYAMRDALHANYMN